MALKIQLRSIWNTKFYFHKVKLLFCCIRFEYKSLDLLAILQICIEGLKSQNNLNSVCNHSVFFIICPFTETLMKSFHFYLLHKYVKHYMGIKIFFNTKVLIDFVCVCALRH